MANQLEGVDSVIRKLESVTKEIKFKGGRFGLRKAANLVADAAKNNASGIDDPETREDIKKNIAVRFSNRTFKRTGNLMFRVGILGGSRQYINNKDNVRAKRVGSSYSVGGDSRNPGGDTFYWRFIEFGTQKMSARPFMRPALEDNVQGVIDTFAKETEKAIDRAIKRAAR